MTDTDALYFWKACAHRRAHQLLQLQNSYRLLLERFDKLTHEEKAMSPRGGQLLDLIHEQQKWVAEQQQKLEHAEDMVRELE